MHATGHVAYTALMRNARAVLEDSLLALDACSVQDYARTACAVIAQYERTVAYALTLTQGN